MRQLRVLMPEMEGIVLAVHPQNLGELHDDGSDSAFRFTGRGQASKRHASHMHLVRGWRDLWQRSEADARLGDGGREVVGRDTATTPRSALRDGDKPPSATLPPLPLPRHHGYVQDSVRIGTIAGDIQKGSLAFKEKSTHVGRRGGLARLKRRSRSSMGGPIRADDEGYLITNPMRQTDPLKTKVHPDQYLRQGVQGSLSSTPRASSASAASRARRSGHGDRRGGRGRVGEVRGGQGSAVPPSLPSPAGWALSGPLAE